MTVSIDARPRALPISKMRLLLASLAYYGRANVAVGCAVAVGAAVVTGALLVGDSMRGSLRQLTLERLGRIDQALVAQRFFREKLADELAAHPGFPPHAAAVPALLLRVSVEKADGGERPARANRVQLVGCDWRFWALASDATPTAASETPSRLVGGPNGPPQASPGVGQPVPAPGPREVVLNQALADQLQVHVGDAVLLRLPEVGAIPADSPLGRKSETVRGHRATVREIIPARGFGRFSLEASQQTPRNAYVSLAWLQDRLRQPDRVNAILVAGASESIQALLEPRLEDYGIRVARTPREYLHVTSDRMLLEPAVETAALATSLAAAGVQPAFTYLANTIACRGREIPYSTITAVDFTDRPPLGPMRSLDGKPVAPLADGEIALNRWAAEDLQARPGDTVLVKYFEPETSRGEVLERSATFRLAAILELAGAAADPDFTPEVPGVTDQKSINEWNPPFPFDAERVRKKDDEYWQAHRATPKAFVSLRTGRKLWASRFGQTTSIRFATREPAALERIRAELRPPPAAMGFVFQPVKAQGLAASAGTTPFELLFLGFSFFLIAAAAMLVALVFRLGVDRRAREIGILLAVGWGRGSVTALWFGEALFVAAAGSAVGLAAGIGYAALLIAGLHTLWLAAVVTPFLSLHVQWTSLAMGFASGLAVAVAAMGLSAWRASRGRPRRLLAGEIDSIATRIGPAPRWANRLAGIALAAAAGLAVLAGRASDDFQAPAFFGAGALVLAASLLAVWGRLERGATGPAVAVGRGNLLRLAARSAARNPLRSTLSIGLVAAASFLIVAVSAFRRDPAKARPDLHSANGGFTIVAETDQPIHYDLNTPEGRQQLGFEPDDSQALAAARTLPLRLRPGDDASCLNLYRPRQPRILGLPREFLERGGFAWASVASPADLGSGQAAPPPANPWRLLETELAPDEDGVPRVPVVLEKNTANYSLQLWKGVGESLDIQDGAGRPVRLVVVGLLKASLFQGDLLISEKAFLNLFPEQVGFRFFLIETDAHAAKVEEVRRVLERTLGDFGIWTQIASQRLAAFQAVENTYLSTFQSLGGLGLLLGTFGLGAVQLRSVLERRRELATLRATGFRRRTLAALVTLENAMLLGAGLGCGVFSAAVAVLPHLWTGSAAIPWASLAGTLGLVLGTGLAAGLAAVRAAVRSPLLAALRGE